MRRHGGAVERDNYYEGQYGQGIKEKRAVESLKRHQ